MIRTADPSHREMMANATLSLPSSEPRPFAEASSEPERIRALVKQNVDFVWLLLRRLGIAEADVDDGVQQVFVVLARRLSEVQTNSERSFLYSTSLRVASEYRRRVAERRALEQDDAVLHDAVDPAPLPDERLGLGQARAHLDQILNAMPVELSATLVLYEIQEMSAREIAELQGVPMGTAASRIRKAREVFDQQVRDLEARADKGGKKP